MNDFLKRIKECAEFIKSRFGNIPTTAVILGTGLGKLADDIKDQEIINYSDIPNSCITLIGKVTIFISYPS